MISTAPCQSGAVTIVLRLVHDVFMIQAFEECYPKDSLVLLDAMLFSVITFFFTYCYYPFDNVS